MDNESIRTYKPISKDGYSSFCEPSNSSIALSYFNNENAAKGKECSNLAVLLTENIPILDIDFLDINSNPNIEIGRVIELLSKRDSKFRLYRTKKGLRVIDLYRLELPIRYLDRDYLGSNLYNYIDPIYIDSCLSKEKFVARVSPKHDRIRLNKAYRIVNYIGLFGKLKNNPIISSRDTEIFIALHDHLCQSKKTRSTHDLG